MSFHLSPKEMLHRDVSCRKFDNFEKLMAKTEIKGPKLISWSHKIWTKYMYVAVITTTHLWGQWWYNYIMDIPMTWQSIGIPNVCKLNNPYCLTISHIDVSRPWHSLSQTESNINNRATLIKLVFLIRS